jgi:hypothetical protein
MVVDREVVAVFLPDAKGTLPVGKVPESKDKYPRETK